MPFQEHVEKVHQKFILNVRAALVRKRRMNLQELLSKANRVVAKWFDEFQNKHQGWHWMVPCCPRAVGHMEFHKVQQDINTSVIYVSKGKEQQPMVHEVVKKLKQYRDTIMEATMKHIDNLKVASLGPKEHVDPRL